MGPAVWSRTRATVRSARPRCPGGAESGSYLSVDLSQHRGSYFIREIPRRNKKNDPVPRPRRPRRPRRSRRPRRPRRFAEGRFEAATPSRPAGHPAVGKNLFRASSAVPVHKRPPFVAHDHTPNPTKFAGDSTNHRHASTRCPAEEAGTIVCPETPALRAERGDSPMLCEGL